MFINGVKAPFITENLIDSFLKSADISYTKLSPKSVFSAKQCNTIAY